MATKQKNNKKEKEELVLKIKPVVFITVSEARKIQLDIMRQFKKFIRK